MIAQDEAVNIAQPVDASVEAVAETIENALDTDLTAEDTPVSQTLPSPTISVDNPVETPPQEIKLAWDSIDDANSYSFELCSDSACESVMLFYNNLKDPEIEFPSLNEQQYFWRVRAVNANGEQGDFSSAQPLLVSAEFIPATPVPTTPTPTISEAESGEAPWFATYLGPLPWYLWIIMLAYLYFILRVSYWYMGR
ncbi:MAG: hypothetical protein HKN88_03390 [Gammaproteobacteria bacterium]|nr:hypothetical protein [Gammaproteobacteria bacterium]